MIFGYVVLNKIYLILQRLQKKALEKVLFSLVDNPLPLPAPPPLSGLSTFFAASLGEAAKNSSFKDRAIKGNKLVKIFFSDGQVPTAIKLKGGGAADG